MKTPNVAIGMGTKLTVTIDLERELDDGRLHAGDLVELLCADLPWAKASLTIEQKEQLAELVAYCGLVHEGAPK